MSYNLYDIDDNIMMPLTNVSVYVAIEFFFDIIIMTIKCISAMYITFPENIFASLQDIY